MPRMSQPQTHMALAVPALFLPWLLRMIPWQGRCGVVLALGGFGLWLFFRKSDGGPFLLALAVASAWIALASFPLAPSKWPPPLLYAPLLALMAAPFAIRRSPLAFRFAALALAIAVVLTPPGRRFAGGERDPAIRALAASAADPRGAVALVHQRIERRKGPPTDTAADTLRRGYAHCGGINNLLHKVLLAQGVDSRILHAERGGGAVYHTLVEARVGGIAYLADAQENLWLPQEAAVLLTGDDRPERPLVWRNYDTLYEYVPRRGYVRRSSGEKSPALDRPPGSG